MNKKNIFLLFADIIFFTLVFCALYAYILLSSQNLNDNESINDALKMFPISISSKHQTINKENLNHSAIIAPNERIDAWSPVDYTPRSYEGIFNDDLSEIAFVKIIPFDLKNLKVNDEFVIKVPQLGEEHYPIVTELYGNSSGIKTIKAFYTTNDTQQYMLTITTGEGTTLGLIETPDGLFHLYGLGREACILPAHKFEPLKRLLDGLVLNILARPE